MARILILFPMLLLPGCGEPEPARFVPAKDDAPNVSASDRPPGGKAPAEATIPKNIPMH